MTKQDTEIKEKFISLILDELTIKAVCKLFSGVDCIYFYYFIG